MRVGTIFWTVVVFLFASSAAGAGRGKLRHRPTSSKDPGFLKPNSPSGNREFLNDHKNYTANHWGHERAKEPTQPAPIPPPPPRNDRKLNGAENTGIVLMNDSESSVQNDSKNSSAGCPHGWKGESCSESLYCVIITPAKAHDIDKERKICDFDSEEELENVWKVQNRTQCLSTCDISMALNGTTHCVYQNMTYYIVPINSTCNTEANFWVILKTHEYLITGGLGIIALLILITCIVCTIKKKRYNVKKTDDIPMQSENNHECMVENNLYGI